MSCLVPAAEHRTLIANCRPGMSTRVAALSFLRSLKALNLIRPIAMGYSTPVPMGMSVFQELTAKGAYFLSKLLIGTTLRNAGTSEKIYLGATLRSFVGNILEIHVIMGNDKHHVPCRLIGLRVTKQVANARRRKLRKEAEKKGRTPSKNHLALCDWTLFVTNASSEILPVNIVLSLYRLRWQIELIFKQLKGVLRVHSSNTTK